MSSSIPENTRLSRSPKPRWFGLACALATILIWASSFPAITVALQGFSPLPLAALRFAIAGLVLGLAAAVLSLRSGARVELKLPSLRDAAYLAGCGLLGIAIYNWLLNTGQQSVSPGAAGFLIACQPAFAALVARRVHGEPFGRTAWIGTGACLIGALVLSLGQPGGLALGGGAPLVLLAAVCSGAFFALQRPMTARYGALGSALAVVLFGALWLSPWIGRGLVELSGASATAIIAMVFLGVLPGALAYVTWMAAIRDLGAARAANLLFFMAPAAALISVPITGEWPGPTTWIGGALALAGVMVVHRSREG